MKKSEVNSALEALESRIAPASLLHYTDVDGDQVTISASKGSLDGHATFAPTGDGQQLQKLDLTDDTFAHANIKMTVKKSPGGDGFANIGFLDATGNDLGTVTLKGDLGKIAAGDGNAAEGAIKSLKVHSMGQFGIGKVSVKANWLASNLAAGAESVGGPGTYGNASDTTILADDTAGIIARIADIHIRGAVFGTTASGDHYGFVAQEIDRVTIGKVRVPLVDGSNNDVVAFAEATGDVTLREIS